MSHIVQNIKTEISKVLVGQEKMVEGLLAGLICKGHILLEGVPGLAKTTAVNALANVITSYSIHYTKLYEQALVPLQGGYALYRLILPKALQPFSPVLQGL